MISTEVILFAIRAGVRLGQEARQTYIDSTKRRELVLPLPRFDFGPNVDSTGVFSKTKAKNSLMQKTRVSFYSIRVLRAAP